MCRILESATIAAARGVTAPAFLSHLILPSHLLRIARDFYDKGKRGDCIEFCRRAYDMKQRLPQEAQIEVLRLWGLSAVRLNDMDAYRNVQNELSLYTATVAKRVSYFLEGFNFRLRGDLDEAEEMHLKAWALSQTTSTSIESWQVFIASSIATMTPRFMPEQHIISLRPIHFSSTFLQKRCWERIFFPNSRCTEESKGLRLPKRLKAA